MNPLVAKPSSKKIVQAVQCQLPYGLKLSLGIRKHQRRCPFEGSGSDRQNFQFAQALYLQSQRASWDDTSVKLLPDLQEILDTKFMAASSEMLRQPE